MKNNLCVTTVIPWKSSAASLLLRKQWGKKKVRFSLLQISMNLPIKLQNCASGNT